MRLLSPILEKIVYPALGQAGYFHRRDSASVVTYHGVVPEQYRSEDAFLDNTLLSVAGFTAHLRLLKKHYAVIDPDYFFHWLRGEATLPERAVLLTCDDGLLNNLSVMVPILRQEGLKCLFFVTGQSLTDAPGMLWYVQLYLMLMRSRARSEAFEWQAIHVSEIAEHANARRAQWHELVTSLSRLDELSRTRFLCKAGAVWGLAPNWHQLFLDDPAIRQRFQLLNAPQLIELAESGMSIGAHTISHPALSQLPPDAARDEIAGCRKDLEAHLRASVLALAYPFGNAAAVGEREYRMALETGYECAFMNVSGDLRRASRFALPRVHVTAEMSLEVFEAHLSGFHEELRSKFRSS